MRRYLVVANQTLGGAHLVRRLRAAAARGPCSFFFLVPATPPQDHATWTEGEAEALAGERLARALIRARELGVEVDGDVGDPDPVQAIADAMIDDRYDEIIVSTLPPGISRWLKLDLPHRVERRFDVPVTHVVGEPEPARG
ncbi:MAG TPA: hypothetical protein VF058_09300 [Actinomycetota bacterium]